MQVIVQNEHDQPKALYAADTGCCYMYVHLIKPFAKSDI